MILRLRYAYLFLLIFIFSAQIYGQNVSQEDSAKLSFADDKRVYRIGEPIKLILAISVKPGTSLIADGVSLTEEEFLLTPTDGAFGLEQQKLHLYGNNDDSTGIFENAPIPYNIPFFLNNFYRFDKPGKYSLKINTRRIYNRRSTHNSITLSTNRIDFEIKEMSQKEEVEEVKRLAAAIDSQNQTLKNLSIQELNFLVGDAATTEKVGRYLKNGYEFSSGLYFSRNKLLAIKLLEEAFNDVKREPTTSLLGTLISLRVWQEYESSAVNEFDPQKLIAQTFERQNQLNLEYLTKLFESLPVRTGRSRTFAAYIIFTLSPKESLSDPAFIAAKQIVLENFDSYDLLTRSMLTSAYWDKLNNLLLIPSIKKIIAETDNPSLSYIRLNALQKLIEIDEKNARPLAIKEILRISDKQSFVNVDMLAKLSDKYLPEIDQTLLTTIKNLAEDNNVKKRYEMSRLNLLAARYASPKIYDELLNIYKTHSPKWEFYVKSGLLAYFAKVNDKSAKPMIEQELTKVNSSQNFSVFNDLTKFYFPKSVYQILRNRLEGDDLNIAGNAAYYISKRGVASDKKILLTRYYRWFNERFKINQDLNQRRASNSFQINLISSLTGSKSWKLTEKEHVKLNETCPQESCQRYFQHP